MQFGSYIDTHVVLGAFRASAALHVPQSCKISSSPISQKCCADFLKRGIVRSSEGRKMMHLSEFLQILEFENRIYNWIWKEDIGN